MSRTCVAVVGMNGTGKSTFGKRLGAKLGLKRIDTDRVFDARYGDHLQFIERNGWQEYRKREEEIVLASLLPGFVVILSGGAIESEKVRAALAEKAVTIWIQAGAKKVTKHLRRAKVTRPEFTEGIEHEQVQSMLDARNPHYEAVADITLFPGTPFARQVPVAMLELRKYGFAPADPRR